MANPRRDVPFSVLWSGAATVLAYGIPILAILIVLPASQVSGYATLTGAGLILGRIAAIVFIFALASAGTTWIMGSDRTEAVAADDGGGPRVLGRYFAAVLGLTFWALLATVALIWPGFGVNWFGGGGNPNDNLAALSFSHQRLQYELTQIVPLAVIVGVGVVFYLLGGKTRRETAAEPVAPAYVPADHHEPAP
jgi:hypothetical protein